MFVAMPPTNSRLVTDDNDIVCEVTTLVTNAVAQKIAAVVLRRCAIVNGRREVTIGTGQELRRELLPVGVLAVGIADCHRYRKSIVKS